MARSKYSIGALGVCERCGCRPCECDPATGELEQTGPAPAAAMNGRASGQAADPAVADRPKSGNAMRYTISDLVIPYCGLTPTQQAVLWRLERITTGRGRHSGDFIYNTEIAAQINVSVRTVQRMLHQLKELGLISITQQFDADAKTWGPSHIRVDLLPLPLHSNKGGGW